MIPSQHVTASDSQYQPRARRLSRRLRYAAAGMAWLLGPTCAFAQPAVDWELQVIEQGQLVDQFHDTTTLGQASTKTASHPSRHTIACPPPGAASASGPGTALDFNLVRTITVSPVHLTPDQISLAIDTRETLEDPSSLATQIDCAALPDPRVITASHPALPVKTDGSWTTWQIIDHDPALSYRVKAVLAHP